MPYMNLKSTYCHYYNYHLIKCSSTTTKINRLKGATDTDGHIDNHTYTDIHIRKASQAAETYPYVNLNIINSLLWSKRHKYLI